MVALQRPAGNEEANATPAEFVRDKIRADRQRPGGRRAARARRTTRSAPSASASTPTTTRRSTATTSTLVDLRRAPIETITRDGIRTARDGVRARRHRLRHRLRRHDRRRCTRIDIRGRGRRGAGGEVGGRAADLPGHARSPASRTCSSITGPGSPSVLQQHGGRRSSSTSTGSPTASPTCASTGLDTIEADARGGGRVGRARQRDGRPRRCSRPANSWYIGRQHPRQAAGLHALHRWGRQRPEKVRRDRVGWRPLKASSSGSAGGERADRQQFSESQDAGALAQPPAATNAGKDVASAESEIK